MREVFLMVAELWPVLGLLVVMHLLDIDVSVKNERRTPTFKDMVLGSLQMVLLAFLAINGADWIREAVEAVYGRDA